MSESIDNLETPGEQAAADQVMAESVSLAVNAMNAHTAAHRRDAAEFDRLGREMFEQLAHMDRQKLMNVAAALASMTASAIHGVDCVDPDLGNEHVAWRVLR